MQAVGLVYHVFACGWSARRRPFEAGERAKAEYCRYTDAAIERGVFGFASMSSGDAG